MHETVCCFLVRPLDRFQRGFATFEPILAQSLKVGIDLTGAKHEAGLVPVDPFFQAQVAELQVIPRGLGSVIDPGDEESCAKKVM